MDIIKGHCYINRTWKYLFPCIKAYGDTFKIKHNTVFTLAVGIKDCYLDNIEKPCLYILIDKTVKTDNYTNYIKWLRIQSFYITDYAYDDPLKGYKQIVVIELPIEYYNSYYHFMEGNYSKMFTEKQKEFLFVKNFNPEKYPFHEKWVQAKRILDQDITYISTFIEIVKEEFGKDMILTQNDFLGKELDFPLTYAPETEIYNYGKC